MVTLRITHRLEAKLIGSIHPLPTLILLIKLNFNKLRDAQGKCTPPSLKDKFVHSLLRDREAKLSDHLLMLVMTTKMITTMMMMVMMMPMMMMMMMMTAMIAHVSVYSQRGPF